MLRVRFPNGYTLTYNDAKTVRGWGDKTEIVDRRGRFIAIVPNEAIVETCRPCFIKKPHDSEDLDNAIRVVAEQLPERPYINGSGVELADIKRELRDFDARTGDWA